MISRIRQWFSGRYIAAESQTGRRDPGTRVRSSDAILTESGRGRMTEGARELWRNYSVAAWAIRKHLDFVSMFTFSSSNGVPEFDKQLEALVEHWSRPVNFDVAQRHSLRRAMRLFEIRRVIDGDVFAVKLKDGRIQPIEGHRVRDPDVVNKDPWTHGIKTDKGGALRAVSIHKQDKYGRMTPERIVGAQNILQLGYFDSFDQIRGVSPLSSAITQFQDVLEVSDFARMKAKVTQLFALAITREMADWDDDEEETTDEYSIDFGKGPIKLEMDPGDKADFLESKHPSTEFREFMQTTLQAALKALDIPWSFYSEDFTNFFGSKAALQNYLQSCKSKRDDLKEFLNRLFIWKLNRWVAEGLITLPVPYISDLKWDWIPAGMPWWDTSKEVKGDLDAINGRLRSRTEIRRERFGDDWRNVVRKLKEEEDFLEELGLQVLQVEQTQQPSNEGDSA